MRKNGVQGALIRKLQADTRGNLFIRLPKAITAAMGWQKGDRIAIILVGKDRLELRRLSGSERV